MKAKSFFLRHHLAFYILICLLENVLAVISTELTVFPMPENYSVCDWENFLTQHAVVITFLGAFCYIFPVFLCAQYGLRTRKYKKSDREYIKILVHSPFALALRGTCGWISNFIFNVAFLIYFKIAFGYDIVFLLCTAAFSYFFVTLFSFTFVYFTLETLNRNLVLPNLYPKGNISDTERISLSSIKAVFIFYFFSAAFFPTVFLGVRIFFTRKFSIQIKSYSDIIFAALALAAGIGLTMLISSYFQKPLKKLCDQANQIEKGNYDARAVICSNDEMGVLGDSFNAMSKSLKEKELIRDTFGKVVAPQVRDYLLSGNLALGGEMVDATIMFCDIRGFTSLSEKMLPEKVVALLNEYFTGLEKCVASHGGVVNKYIGDAVMAIFGAPIPTKTHANDAFLAALDMKQELILMNRNFSQKGFPQIQFGIGLHSGPVLAGNIGAASRMEYTVIGDTVNTASRIEGLCKLYQKDLLLSQSVFDLLPQKENLLFVDEAGIRGKKEKVRLYSR